MFCATFCTNVLHKVLQFCICRKLPAQADSRLNVVLHKLLAQTLRNFLHKLFATFCTNCLQLVCTTLFANAASCQMVLKPNFLPKVPKRSLFKQPHQVDPHEVLPEPFSNPRLRFASTKSTCVRTYVRTYSSLTQFGTQARADCPIIFHKRALPCLPYLPLGHCITPWGIALPHTPHGELYFPTRFLCFSIVFASFCPLGECLPDSGI